MTTITNMTMYQAIVLKSGLGLYIKTNGRVIPHRGWTITKALKLASNITGKTFTRNQKAEAVAALEAWLEGRKAAGEHLQVPTPLTTI